MAHEVSLDAFNQLQRGLDQLNETVYTGNGEPGLVSRVTAVEKGVATMTRFGWYAIGAMFSTFAILAADLIVRLLK